MARSARKRGLELGLHIAALAWGHPTTARLRGGMVAAFGVCFAVALATYNVTDPSLNAVSTAAPANALGGAGATLADFGVQSLGLAAGVAALLMVLFGLYRAVSPHPDETRGQVRLRAIVGVLGLLALAALLAAPPAPGMWPLARGLGGFWGDGLLSGLAGLIAYARLPFGKLIAALLFGAVAAGALGYSLGLRRLDLAAFGAWAAEALSRRPRPLAAEVQAPLTPMKPVEPRRAARATLEDRTPEAGFDPSAPGAGEPASPPVAIKAPKSAPKDSGRELREAQGAFDFVRPTGGFALPELAMLAKPKPRAAAFDEGALRQNAQLLESVLAEFGVRGQIDQIRPGPVVTLYELVPAPGVKSARVVALSDDIARSMSVASARVSVVPGRNAIGIELPNQRRETVYLRELLSAPEYERGGQVVPVV
ncbi:MAG TPA: DNA translocase FtsK 4TM domain-containing protein, partial [Phenylobacterium sp.]|nr:DNA translocase FtsK 4TM domain-containing protein [Phenylobacterium sp.]